MTNRQLEIKYAVHYENSNIDSCKQRVLIDSSMSNIIVYENRLWIDKVRNAPCNLESVFTISRINCEPNIKVRVFIRVNYSKYANGSPCMNIETDLICYCTLNNKQVILKYNIDNKMPAFDRMIGFIIEYLPIVLSMSTDQFMDAYSIT